MEKPSSNPKKVESGIQNAEAPTNPTPISHTWTNSFSPTEKKKQWSEEQCRILLELKNEGRSYIYISGEIPEHTPDECRRKWGKRLKSTWYAQQLGQVAPLARGRWLTEEDALCVALRMGGESWKAISAELPGRSPQACNRHFLKEHPVLVQERRRQGFNEDEEQDDDDDGDDGMNEEDDVGYRDTGEERTTDGMVMDNEADAEGVLDEGEDWWKGPDPFKGSHTEQT